MDAARQRRMGRYALIATILILVLVAAVGVVAALGLRAMSDTDLSGGFKITNAPQGDHR